LVQRVSTVAFEGIEARAVDVQVQVAPRLAGVRDRRPPRQGGVGSARAGALGADRLGAGAAGAPDHRQSRAADLPKEGSHYDLPIALGLMAAIGAIPPDALAGFTVLGELGLDGSIAAVAGVLPAAIGANAREEGLICPASAARRRPGRARHPDRGGAFADPDRQPF